MKTKVITLYTINELKNLDDGAFEKAYNSYINHFDFDFDSELILDNFKSKLEDMGFNDLKFYYRGFSSQGDGACFEYFINQNSKLFNDFIKDKYSDRQVKYIKLFIENGYFDISIEGKHYGRNYHEKSINQSSYADIYTEQYINIYTNINMLLNNLLDDFENFVQEKQIQLSKELYSNLMTVYDDVTSEASFIELCEENGFYFTENGVLTHG
jgi:hypothetical protein